MTKIGYLFLLQTTTVRSESAGLHWNNNLKRGRRSLRRRPSHCTSQLTWPPWNGDL